jgi:hypothetical protein
MWYFSDTDVVAINDKTVHCHFIYKRRCSGSNHTFYKWNSNYSTYIWSISLFHITMRVNDKRFDGTSHSFDTKKNLRATAGNVSWFTEYRPVKVVGLYALHYLLREFFRHHICCHLSGSYVAYTAGILHSFRAVTLYVYRDDRNPPANCNFSTRVENYWVFHSRGVLF